MTQSYADEKIREAMTLAKGNKTKAQHIVTVMAQKDLKLLQSLTKNHMTGIVAYHIDRVVSGKSSLKRPMTEPEVKKSKPKLVNTKPNKFGMEVLKAATTGSGEVFGFDTGAPTGKRGKASQDHINAIKLLASRNRTR